MIRLKKLQWVLHSDVEYLTMIRYCSIAMSVSDFVSKSKCYRCGMFLSYKYYIFLDASKLAHTSA